MNTPNMPTETVMQVTCVDAKRDIWVITGPQGCGKSTLAAKMGLRDVQPGESVWLDRGVALTHDAMAHGKAVAAVRARIDSGVGQ